MTDRYENIRKALAMGPAPGPWGFTEMPRDIQRDGYRFTISRRGLGWWFAQVAHEANSIANATYIAACDPGTIRELLAERDQLAAEIEALRAEVERLRADRDSWEQQASDRVTDWYAEHLRAERLAGALEEIRSRSTINLAMRSDTLELTAMLGNIHQIADAMLAEQEKK